MGGGNKTGWWHFGRMALGSLVVGPALHRARSVVDGMAFFSGLRAVAGDGMIERCHRRRRPLANKGVPRSKRGFSTE